MSYTSNIFSAFQKLITKVNNLVEIVKLEDSITIPNKVKIEVLSLEPICP